MLPDNDHFVDGIDGDDEAVSHRPSFMTALILLLLVLAMLVTMFWPLLRNNPRRLPRPTPTPSFLREASVDLTPPIALNLSLIDRYA